MGSGVLKAGFLAWAALLTPVLADDIAVVRSFPGNTGPGWKQTIDVAGAVGPQHFVDFDVASFVVHDKRNGEVLKRLSSQEFWQHVEPAGELVPVTVANDARMLYDPLSERWFACAAGAPEADCFLAVSTTSNPLDPWRGAKLPLPRINPYMKMGVDRNGLYICSCNGHAEPLKAMNCYVIPKRDAIAPGGPVLTNASNFPALQFSSMPATDLEPNKPTDAPEILLTNEFSDGICDKLYLYRVIWSGLQASLSDVQVVPLKNVYHTPNNTTPAMEAFQPEPGPKLRAGGGGRRLDSAFVHNGSVFGCNGAKRSADSRPGVLWYEVRISDGKVLQEGFVDSPDRDFIYPSIAVDGHGNIGIGCTGTSQTEFPSVYVMMHGAHDPPGTMRSPVCAVSGTTSYHYEGQQSVNWSHYSATCVDPSDPDLLWTLQAYGNSTVDREWCTAWAAFHLSEGKPPARVDTSATGAPPIKPVTVTRVRESAVNESFTGIAARSGTFKRPLLDVNGTRYELQASADADESVVELLRKFSEGDTGQYVVKGTRGTVNGKEGIVIDSIAPATMLDPKPAPAPANPNPAKMSPAATSTSPQVTVSVVTIGDDRYTVYDYDDLIARRCSFVIPEGLKTVRGLLVHGCYSGGDSRYDWKDCEYYRQFMHLHGFVYVGNTFAAGPLFGRTPQPADTSAMARHRAIFDSFEESVKSVATVSQHPEMVNAPYAGVGFSAGGGNALNLMCFAPEKTIAAASYCAPYLFKRRITGPPSDELLRVPAIAITGELEGFNVPLPADVDPATGPARIDEVFLPYRPKGATYAWMERQGQGHAYFENRQDVLGMPFLDACVRARYPKDGDVTKGPIKLIDIDPNSGWIADNASWKSGLTKIVPASEFGGDLGHSSWLLNEDLAFIYRAYSTYDNLLTITSPGNCWPTMPALEEGSSVPITVDASQFRNWKTIAFYDGATKLGEVNAGESPQFTASDLTPGYHVFSILATDSDGTVRTADPKIVIVKPSLK